MNMSLTKLLAYVAMLAFDFGTFAGTAYLIVKHGWSFWWMALPIFMALGAVSAPGRFIEK
jgi:hypothetical protein